MINQIPLIRRTYPGIELFISQIPNEIGAAFITGTEIGPELFVSELDGIASEGYWHLEFPLEKILQLITKKSTFCQVDIDPF